MSGPVDSVSFVQINPENYQSRPPLPEDVPLAHTDSSVHLTSFALYFDLKLPLDLGLIVDESCLQVLRLVGRRRISRTGRWMSRPSSLEGLRSGGPLLLGVVTGEFEL